MWLSHNYMALPSPKFVSMIVGIREVHMLVEIVSQWNVPGWDKLLMHTCET